MSSTSSTRRRFTPFALLTGVAGSVVLASSMNGSLAAFTASITNTTNTAASGTVTMQETNFDGSIICNSTDGTGGVSGNTANCATINKYGGNVAMVPNQTVTTNIIIKNTGTAPAATFTLTPGTCAQSVNGTVNGSALDFCKKVNVKVTVGATAVFTGTAFTLTAPIALAAPVAPGATVAIKFDVTLDTTADNTYQGLKASQPLTWTFSS